MQAGVINQGEDARGRCGLLGQCQRARAEAERVGYDRAGAKLGHAWEEEKRAILPVGKRGRVPWAACGKGKSAGQIE